MRPKTWIPVHDESLGPFALCRRLKPLEIFGNATPIAENFRIFLVDRPCKSHFYEQFDVL